MEKEFKTVTTITIRPSIREKIQKKAKDSGVSLSKYIENWMIKDLGLGLEEKGEKDA